MSQTLPQRKFKWVTNDGINNFDVGQVSDDFETGYIVEVDLEYPEEWRDRH